MYISQVSEFSADLSRNDVRNALHAPVDFEPNFVLNLTKTGVENEHPKWSGYKILINACKWVWK